MIPSDADWELVCQEWNDRRHAEGSLGGLTAGNGKELVGLEIADPTTATADKGVKS